jgi:hypothetical protein
MSDRYPVADLTEVAAGLRRLLAAIASGELTADAGTVAGLEGAATALEALDRTQDPK